MKPLRVCALLALWVVFCMGFTVLAVDAIEEENAWRAERLCRIYGVCR